MASQKKRGGTRMKEFGYKRVTVWFDPSEWKLIEAEARRVNQPVATWLRKLAWAWAVAKDSGPMMDVPPVDGYRDAGPRHSG